MHTLGLYCSNVMHVREQSSFQSPPSFLLCQTAGMMQACGIVHSIGPGEYSLTGESREALLKLVILLKESSGRKSGWQADWFLYFCGVDPQGHGGRLPRSHGVRLGRPPKRSDCTKSIGQLAAPCNDGVLLTAGHSSPPCGHLSIYMDVCTPPPLTVVRHTPITHRSFLMGMKIHVQWKKGKLNVTH